MTQTTGESTNIYRVGFGKLDEEEGGLKAFHREWVTAQSMSAAVTYGEYVAEKSGTVVVVVELIDLETAIVSELDIMDEHRVMQ